MNIRSITIFLPIPPSASSGSTANPAIHMPNVDLQNAAKLRQSAVKAFEQAGFTVQSTRLATTPFPRYLPLQPLEPALDWVTAFERQSLQAGFDYLSLGPALPEREESIPAVVEILKHTQNVFLSSLLTIEQKIAMEAIRHTARAICQISTLEANGFANLRFAALANVPGGAPFFPAAYHDGNELGFALAMEAADMFLEEIRQAEDFDTAQSRLIARIEKEAHQLAAIAESTASQYQARFFGIDFTPAPFPEPLRSFGTLVEQLGVPRVGDHGSLATSAFITAVLDQAQFPRAGFNGLMLPVLEDDTLARRAAEGALTVKDLLMVSAVCGTGLDTVPLAGDVSPAALEALLLDLAALSLRLDKPLTARLMPIPGKKAGETTQFDFAYFANSRILALDAQPLQGFFAHAQTLPVHPRPPTKNV